MNEGSRIWTSSVVARSGALGASSAFPRTRPSYPSLTIHVSHPLYDFVHIAYSSHGGKRGGGDVLENACFDDGAHDGVHAGAVASRGENCEFHCEVLICVPSQDTGEGYILIGGETGVGVGNYGISRTCSVGRVIR